MNYPLPPEAVKKEECARQEGSAEPHLRITPTDAKEMWLQKKLTPKGYLQILILSHRRAGWWFRIDNVSQFCRDWEIKRRTFYKAKAELIAEGVLEENIIGAVEIRITTMRPCEQPCTGVHGDAQGEHGGAQRESEHGGAQGEHGGAQSVHGGAQSVHGGAQSSAETLVQQGFAEPLRSITSNDQIYSDLNPPLIPPEGGSDDLASEEMNPRSEQSEPEQQQTPAPAGEKTIQSRTPAKSGSGAKKSSRRRSAKHPVPKIPGDPFVPEGAELGDQYLQNLVNQLCKEFQSVEAVEGAMQADALEKFELFWQWYERNISGLPHASAARGDRKKALIAFAIVWETNYLGHGIEAFRSGGLRAAQDFGKRQGQGSVWAAYFLLGKGGGQPYWVPHKSEAPTGEFMPDPSTKPATAENPMQQIAAELKRLNLPGLLPGEWQQRTGCVTVGQLDDDTARDYLQYLRALKPAGQHHPHQCH